eukprot:14859781-Heterocapsa_arctica.AAC.1
MEFHNEKMKSLKALAVGSDLTASGVLTPDARKSVEAQIKLEWGGLTEDERFAYRQRHQMNATARAAAPAPIKHRLKADDGPMRGTHWNGGSREASLHPQHVQAAFEAGSRLPTLAEVYNPAEFRIDEALGWSDMLGDDIVIEGCPHRGRNVCENHPERAALTQITSCMTRMTQALGADFAKSCDALFLFESDSSGEEADKHRVFALLTMPNYNPLFQDFTLCHVSDLGMNMSAAEVAYPFHVDLASEAIGLLD